MMLEIRNLSAAYGMHRALAGVSIDVDEGEIVVILGANGAGKSTLLRAVAGMCEGQVQGDVFLDGEPLTGVTPDEIVERGIAFVPEGRGIFGDLTVGENLQLGAYSKHARLRQQENLARVYDLFPKLKERRSQIARTMSGGEQQMVAIGRAIMADPKILMLDEPSLGLSPILCKELFQSLKHITESGMGVLLVEQNAKQSLAIADRGFLLENGEITGQNSAEALLNDPAVQAAYLGGAAGETGTGSAGKAASTPASAVADTEKSFVRPRARTAAAVSADTFAGESISALVARAAGAGKAKVASPVPHPVKPATQAVAPSITPRGGSSYRIADDPEVSKLLASMEESAQAARSGGSTYVSRRQAKRTESAPLPEIEVYRKSTVEVYRRGPGGNLEKVEK
jgi:branched-chain amino acid transport system ATP-binding protein